MIRPRGATVSSVQLSFFSAGEQAPDVADVEGLLAGPGQLVTVGAEARVSVVAGAEWRVAALLAAFAERGLGGSRATSVEGHEAVRTDFCAQLLPLARAWARGAVKAPPPGFALDGPRLRLWVVAGGRTDDHGYVLPLGEADLPSWEAVGGALAAAGLAATLLGPRGGGPAYRVTGRRRLLRLAELVGDPPMGVRPGDWPGADSDRL
ncbi:MAG: hypothetical protein JWN54_3086 [Mycobacterium sp.]|nr:hypothetical protein [Mycobacterium sp.]